MSGFRKVKTAEEIDSGNSLHYLKDDEAITIKSAAGSKAITRKMSDDLVVEYDKFTATFGEIPELSGIVGKKYENDGIWGEFNDNSGILSLFGIGGEEGLANMTYVAKRMHKEGKWSTASQYHVYRHELAHAWQLHLKTTDPLYLQKVAKIENVRKSLFDSLTNLSDSDRIIKEKQLLSEQGLNPRYDLDEFVSECVAEYANGKPRGLSKLIVETLLSREIM